MAKTLLVMDAKGIPNSEHCNDGTECISREVWAGQKLFQRMTNMIEREWSIEGLGHCTNPKCVLSSEKLWFNYCVKLQAEELARKEAMKIQRAKEKAIRYLKWQIDQSRICKEQPPNFKDLHRRSSAKRNAAEIRKWKVKKMVAK